MTKAQWQLQIALWRAQTMLDQRRAAIERCKSDLVVGDIRALDISLPAMIDAANASQNAFKVAVMLAHMQGVFDDKDALAHIEEMDFDIFE